MDGREGLPYIEKPSEWADQQAKEVTKKIIEARKRERKMADYFSQHDHTAFSIEPMPHERQRLDKCMTAEERALRKQWIMDQKLAPNEPRHVPELNRMNIFRRIYHSTYNNFCKAVTPVIGEFWAARLNSRMRYWVGLYGIIVGTVYYYNYTGKPSWTNRDGLTTFRRRRYNYPGDEEYPSLPPAKTFEEMYDNGFSKRKCFKDL